MSLGRPVLPPEVIALKDAAGVAVSGSLDSASALNPPRHAREAGMLVLAHADH